MSEEILLKPEDARSAASDMRTKAQAAQDQFTATRTGADWTTSMQVLR